MKKTKILQKAVWLTGILTVVLGLIHDLFLIILHNEVDAFLFIATGNATILVGSVFIIISKHIQTHAKFVYQLGSVSTLFLLSVGIHGVAVMPFHPGAYFGLTLSLISFFLFYKVRKLQIKIH